MNEADACLRCIVPNLHSAGWDDDPRRFNEQATFTDGRIRVVDTVVNGMPRILVAMAMATGTGKTVIAFQIFWKLWSRQWDRENAYRRPKNLYLAGRYILVDDSKDRTIGPFGDARYKIQSGEIVQPETEAVVEGMS